MKLKLTFIFLFICMSFSQNLIAQEQSIPIQKVEVEAGFPGGQAAWNKYIT